MYGCWALAWYQQEYDNFEIKQDGMVGWLLDMWNVRK